MAQEAKISTQRNPQTAPDLVRILRRCPKFLQFVNRLDDSSILRDRPLSIIAVGLCLFAGLLYSFSDIAVVKLKIGTSSSTIFKIYWASENQSFSESNSKAIPIYRRKTNYTFLLTDISAIRRLRIDPTNRAKTRVRIESLELFQDGFEPLRIKTQADFRLLQNRNEISSRNTSSAGLTIVSAGTDPQLELRLEPHRVTSTLLTNAFRLLIAGGLLIGFVKFVTKSKSTTSANTPPDYGLATPDGLSER